jgi:ABC-2 type transport system permease protein
MTAELLKLRSLPTPRWVLANTLGALVTAIALAIAFGIGEEDDVAVGLGAELTTAIAAIVLGVWVVGVEYGQGTMRRVLTAEPRRLRVLAYKLVLAVGTTAALTVVVFAIATAAFPPIADAHDQALTVGDMLRTGVAALIGNSALAAVGVAFGLLARSMAGGLTAALVYAFIIDTSLSAIPHVGDYTSSGAQLELYDAITRAPGEQAVVQAALVLAAWVGAFVALGATRLVRSDA